MRTLTAHLDQLEASSSTEVRVAVELMMDTGRRPDEIAKLPLDCLETDADGKPVLVYDNHKEYRQRRRLPIAAATAAIITGQQERVRARFPTSSAANSPSSRPPATTAPPGPRSPPRWRSTVARWRPR